MLNSQPHTEHVFLSPGCHDSFLFHVFAPFLPVCVIMSLSCFYHAVELLLQSLPFTWHHSESFKRATLPSGASVYQNATKKWHGDKSVPRVLNPGSLTQSSVCVSSSSYKTTHVSSRRSQEFMRD